MATAAPVEIAAMRRAIELAARGLGHTSPNPVVGCVVLDSMRPYGGRGLASAGRMGRTPRSMPCVPRANAPGAAPHWSPSNPATTPAAPAPAPRR